MSNMKALVVGVSNYYMSGAPNLPFCRNDVIEMTEALHFGLKLDFDDIFTLGESGDVSKDGFIKEVFEIISTISKDDFLIFYFSGHGTTVHNQHYLVFSDGLISTQEIIEFLEKVSAKGKIVFLDCCYSGQFSISGTSVFGIEETVNDFAGRGHAVFSSSNATQVSYGHSDKPISVFTSFLCDALKDKYIIKKGKVSLYDIQKLVRLYIEVWNLKNPDKQQHPIYRASMGGTIYFEVQEYAPFYTSRVYGEYDKYIIYNVKPLHSGLTKRYAVETILKEPLSIEEIGKISLEITQMVKKVEVYENTIAQERFSGKLANIIWIYFGRDESDMVKHNYICTTTWIDDTQDKNWWYRVDNKDTFILNSVHYKFFSYYESLKSINQENTGSKYNVISKTKDILSPMLTIAEKVIHYFNEFKNGVFTEEDLIQEMENIISDINNYYFKSHDLDIPPDEIHDWIQACVMLIGTVYDFSLYYNKKYLSKRTPENRRACMEITIKQYYSDLEKVRKLEEKL